MKWQSSEGSTLPFVAFLMVTFLAVLALGVNLSRLLMDQKRVKNAADAAVIAGMTHLRTKSPAKIYAIAQQTLLANLRQAGLPVDNRLSYQIQLSPPGNPVKISASAQLSRTSGFFASLPFLKDALFLWGEAEAKKLPLDLVLVIDNSGSMANIDYIPGSKRNKSRLDYVKAATNSLVSKLLTPDDALAVVNFSDSAQVLFPFTKNPNVGKVKEKISKLYPFGSTNIGDALSLAGSEMAKAEGGERRRIIFFMSDGAPTSGTPDSPDFKACAKKKKISEYSYEALYEDAVVRARKIREQGVAIYTLGMGQAAQDSAFIYDKDDPYESVTNQDVKLNLLSAISNTERVRGKIRPKFECEQPAGEREPVAQSLHSPTDQGLQETFWTIGTQLQALLTK